MIRPYVFSPQVKLWQLSEVAFKRPAKVYKLGKDLFLSMNWPMGAQWCLLFSYQLLAASIYVSDYRLKTMLRYSEAIVREPQKSRLEGEISAFSMNWPMRVRDKLAFTRNPGFCGFNFVHEYRLRDRNGRSSCRFIQRKSGYIGNSLGKTPPTPPAWIRHSK